MQIMGVLLLSRKGRSPFTPVGQEPFDTAPIRQTCVSAVQGRVMVKTFDAVPNLYYLGNISNIVLFANA